jgi:peptide subunit release factor 1 (eRF1)
MPKLPEISTLLDVDGPVVSAYLSTPSAEPNAAFRLTTHWKTLRGELAAEGADEPTLEAMDAALGVDTAAVMPQAAPAEDNRATQSVDAAADHTGGDVLALVAAGGQVLLRRSLPGPAVAGSARVAQVPWLTPVLEAGQRQVPYVVVLVDRTGADLHGYGMDNEVDATVAGSHDQVERNHPGGWSARRYQQRAIDSWERNAGEVAAEVDSVANRLGARLVLVGGDEHAVSYLTAALPKRWQDRVRVLQHGARAAGGDAEALTAEVDELLQAAVAEDQAAVLERFREGLGQGRKAADGPARVTEALQAALVDTLLVHDDPGADPDEQRMAWFGPEPTQLALDRADLEAMGVGEQRQARLVDVAVRAALATGADVRVVPASVVRDGVGAILRA